MPETTLSKITDHVYWMSPGAPDRPSLCAVVGTEYTILLDAGASSAHARLLLNALTSERVPAPHYVALTHWHWDHVFGAAEFGVPIIAHTATAEHLAILAEYDWSNEALDQRVMLGEETVFCADNIKIELPEPRAVQIVMPNIVFHNSLDIRLGEVICHLRHVGGDHSSDSCVMYVTPDRALFLGDCLYDAVYTTTPHYTTERLFPLLDTILAFDAEYFIDGHADTVMTRAGLESTEKKMRFAGMLVDEIGTDENTVFAAARAQNEQSLDEDTEYFLRAFIAGHKLRMK